MKKLTLLGCILLLLTGCIQREGVSDNSEITEEERLIAIQEEKDAMNKYPVFKKTQLEFKEAMKQDTKLEYQERLWEGEGEKDKKLFFRSQQDLYEIFFGWGSDNKSNFSVLEVIVFSENPLQDDRIMGELLPTLEGVFDALGETYNPDLIIQVLEETRPLCGVNYNEHMGVAIDRHPDGISLRIEAKDVDGDWTCPTQNGEFVG